MIEEYNWALCEERHEYIAKWSEEIKKRMKAVENRFVVILTVLSLNLIGVIGILIATIIK